MNWPLLDEIVTMNDSDKESVYNLYILPGWKEWNLKLYNSM